MGNGSPRLQSQLVRRTAVAALASLAFAPSAFADDGVLPVSPDASTVSAVVAVASVPVTSVATPPATPLSQVQATTDTRTRTSLPPLPATPKRRAASRTPAIHGKAPKLLRRLSSASSLPRVISSPREASADGSAEPIVPPGSSASTPTPPAPRLPLPPPFAVGLGGMSWASAAQGAGLLLLALAAALALGGLPRLGRRVSLLIPALRSYPYLLPLERPD